MYLELDGAGTTYAQLTRALKRAILDGRLKTGDKLPSSRWLATEMGVSRNTVLTVYELLCAEQLAVARRGAGTYVSSVIAAPTMRSSDAAVPPQSRFAARLRALPPIKLGRYHPPLRYDLHYGEPLLDIPLISAWRNQLAHAAERADLRYPLPQGHAALREAICEYLGRRRGVMCSADDIVVTSGTQQALSLLARLLLDEGDVALIEEPFYQMAAQALQLHGARVHAVPADAEGLQLDVWPSAAPRLVHVTPSHQFPSGAVMSLARRLALLHDAVERSYWIVEDDYDGEFRFDARPLPALRSLDLNGRVIYIGSFSKVMFPALRLGYVVCPCGLRKDLIEAKRQHDMGNSAIEQIAIADYMRSGGFDRHLRRAAAELRQRRNALLEGLRRHCAGHIEVADSHAGMHIVGWLPGFTSARLRGLIDLARQRGLGLHLIDPYYQTPPARSGLLLGFAGLSATQIRAATKVLGECLEQSR